MEGQYDHLHFDVLPIELNALRRIGKNMSGFIPFLHCVATDMPRGSINILEIGVRTGASTLSFLFGIEDRWDDSMLYSIDINDCSAVVKPFEKVQRKWQFIQGDSQKVEWDKPIDVLLIDGDHSYEGVRADYTRFEPYVKDNGLILLHDVLWPKKGVARFFWDEITYPKSVLPLSPSGMGIVYKKKEPFYDKELAKKNYGR